MGKGYNDRMVKNRFSGKKVGVLGLGREGLEAVRFLVGCGAEVTVLDAQTQKRLANFAVAKKLKAQFRLGPGYLEDLDDFDILVRSPGMPLDTKELKRAARRGVEISSTIKIFFELCPAKIIGITGSKGKSTTTSLIYHLLSARGRRVFLGGNIGASPLPVLRRLRVDDWVVLELSSFQLEDLTHSPQVAVLLEVVPEHLDRHKTFAKYWQAKSNIFAHQKKRDVLVASRDFVSTRKALRLVKGRVLETSVRQVLRRGVYLDRGEIIYREISTGRRVVVADMGRMKLAGKHNWHNVLPAIGVAILAGVQPSRIGDKLARFKPLAHRLELVAKKNGVLFVDDSLATTPEAAEAAVLAFAGEPRAVILGGVHKGGDMNGLAKTIGLGGVEFVALIGSSAKKWKQALKTHAPRVPAKVFGDFEEAIEQSYAAVKRDGGVVLLSPACASFDMFADAYDRGEEFAQIARKLAK